MNLQVLLSAMNLDEYNLSHLLTKMNIQSDLIVVNQCQESSYFEFDFKGNRIKCLSFPERGIGLSRNNALMRATADIALFADEDIQYVPHYKELILESFKHHPDADMILFNVPSTNQDRPTYQIFKKSRVRFYNCLRYGAVMIAVRTEKVKQANVYFSLLFGGGAKYSAGEDSLFIADCIRKGLKVYTDPKTIGFVSQEESTWFKGYNDKYFIDKGIFYHHLSKRWGIFLCLQFVLRHRKMFQNEKTVGEALKLMFNGARKIG